jgi:WD40 repeat protein/serine/threonine protein kinase
MNERIIFLNALEKEDPAARAAYLDAACAGQPQLRQRVEALLRSHREAGLFLTEPAMDQMEAAEHSLAFLQPTREPDSLGRIDHYEVLDVIGWGSTGVVLRARDTKLQRVVAIKVLGPSLAASRAARARFVREAQAAAAVRDDHVVAIHAVGDEGPVPYLVMEYISGTTLEERVKQAGALELKETLRIGMQVARGLTAAHAQGVVHRDIKPANILLENGVQRVKITDFGLARAAEDGSLARGKVLAGTPAFMSPEQARGEPTDHRTDLFSLGSVLYTLCTGSSPFQGDTTAAVLQCVDQATATPLRWANPNVPEWLCDLVGKLHAREANDRLSSAQAVADLLGMQLTLLQEPSRPPLSPNIEHRTSNIERPTDRDAGVGRSMLDVRRSMFDVRQRRLVVALGVAGLLVALVAVAAWLRPWQRATPESRPGDTAPREDGAPARPLDLRREDIPARLLTLAGGDPAQAPPELAAVLGDGRFLLPHVGQTAWMDQSPDGKLLALPLDEDVVLFDAATGAYLRTLKGPGDRVFQVTFSRDNRLLAATTRREAVGGAVRVWDLRGDRVLFTNAQPGPIISCAAAFSADGKRLFTEGGGHLHIWDARSGRQVREVEMPPGGIASLSVSPDGRRLAVTNWVGDQVKVFDWAADDLAEAHTLRLPVPTTAAVFSPDGRFLATGDDTGFKVWNAQTLREIRTVPAQAHQLAFAPDSRTLYAAATIADARASYLFSRWDVVTGEELPALPVEVSVKPVRTFHCLSRDGKVLFVVGQHDATYVKVIDTTTGKEQFPAVGHAAPLDAVAVRPDGRTVASAGEDWSVTLWDLAGGKVRRTLSAHTGAVCGLAFSRDGRLLASGSRDGTIGLWEVDSGTEVRALHGHSRSVSRIRFSPDGQTVAAGGEHGGVKLWDVATGQEKQPLEGYVGGVRCVAFSPDGNLLASGGEDRTVRLHNLAGGGYARTFTAPKAVNDLAFSPDGTTLAAVGDGPEPAVCLWNLQSGQERTWHGHTGHVQGVAFSPAAPLLATCSEDGTVRLWDLAGSDGRPRTIGPGPFGGPVRAVAFTPDGRYLVTANANGTAYVLRVEAVPERLGGSPPP